MMMEILKTKLATSLKFVVTAAIIFSATTQVDVQSASAQQSHTPAFRQRPSGTRANHQSETRSSSENAKSEYGVVKAGEIVCGHRNSCSHSA